MTEQKMNDLPRKTLCEIVAKYGKSIRDDDRRCEGLLRDLCSGYKRETTVLLSAMRERIPYELLSNSIAGVTMEVTIARLSKRLHDDLAMTFEAARWAVESWALALGVITETEVNTFAANYPSIAPTSRAVPAPKLQPYGGHDRSQCPEIRGFRLGMSLSDVLSHFEGLQVPSANEVGFQEIELGTHAQGTNVANIYPGRALVNKAVYSSVQGLNSLGFEFLDGRVSSIRIVYDGSVKWNSLDEFAKKIGEMFGLSETWQNVGSALRITMQTYRIEVGMGLLRLPVLHLQDIQAERIIKERTAANEDHKRHTFDL